MRRIHGAKKWVTEWIGRADLVVLVAVGVVIAVLDYLVRTIVVGGRAHLHTLLVLFSCLLYTSPSPRD